MVSPEWFFSTLAQSTAAAIGFVVAFSASLYTSRHSKQRERVSIFREDFNDFRDKFEDVLEGMQQALMREGEFDPNRDMIDISREPEEISKDISDWAEKQETPRVAWLYMNISWIRSYIREIQMSTSPLYMKEQLSKMEYPVLNSTTILDIFPDDVGYSAENEILYDEIVRSQESAGQYSDTQDVFGVIPEMRRYLENHTVHSGTGGSFKDWNKTMKHLLDSYYSLENDQYFPLDLFTESEISQVLHRCKLLFFAGVIVPTGFLFIRPDIGVIPEYPQTFILLAEMGTLGIVTFLGWQLFGLITNIMKYDEF